MRKILFACLWIAVILFVVQVAYFLFFSVRGPKYNEGRPLAAQTVSVPVQNIMTLYRDGGDTVWIGTDGHGLHRYSVKDGKTAYVDGSDELTGKRIRCMATDRQGRLWVGTSRDGLYVGSSKEWKHYDLGSRITAIKVAPAGEVIVAHDSGLALYNSETNAWNPLEIQAKDSKDVIEPTDLVFDGKGNLVVATACHGIFRLGRDEFGKYTVAKNMTAKRRFGPGSTPNVAPVPLDPCGEGLPSNQINAILAGSDGTIWAGTAAGLAWSRDNGESWHFLRGRDYGDKMRGLIAGTPYKWKELPRVRFGELLPEDDISLLTEDENGVLWIATRSLGCIALEPNAFYRETLPKNDDPDSAISFLTDMAQNTTRFHGTKADRILSLAALPDGKIMLASSTGKLETMAAPSEFQKSGQTASEERTLADIALPADYTKPSEEPKREETAYPYAASLASDYVTGRDWTERYGKAYALIGGGNYPHDKLVAFDESICKIRPFVGSVGNRTRPLERTVIARSGHHHHHDHGEAKNEEPTETPAQEVVETKEPTENEAHVLSAWSSVGDTVPKTYDGQHLWLDVKLNKPGRYRLSLYFVDPDDLKARREKSAQPPRDHLIEVFSEPPKTRIAKTDWQELGKRMDLMATEQMPLAVGRITDFADGVYKIFELSGPGTYYVKIDKNYSRKIDLCSALIDRLDYEVEIPDMPEKTEEQTSDIIP